MARDPPVGEGGPSSAVWVRVWIGHGIIPWPGRPDTVAHPSVVRDRIRLLRDRRRREELQQVPGELARAFLADVVPAAVDDCALKGGSGVPEVLGDEGP